MNNIYIVYGENFEAINDFEKKVAQNYLKTLDEFNYIKLNMNDTTIENLVYECPVSYTHLFVSDYSWGFLLKKYKSI